MKIESFHIQGFKSIADLKVDGLSDINIFFGLNDVGKSNILQALALWHTVITSRQVLTFREIEEQFSPFIFSFGANKEILISVNLLLENTENPYPLDNKRLNNITTHVVIREREINRQVETPTGVFRQDKVREVSSKWPKLHVIEASRRFQTETRQQTSHSLGRITHQNLKRALFYAYLSRDLEQKQRLTAIKRILSNSPFNLGEIDIALDPVTEQIDIGFVQANGRLPIENLGSGSQQLLLMLGQVFLNDYPIITLEEPEMNLSPQYQGLLLSTLRQLMQDPAVKLNQLFISTHSPYLEFQENFYDVTRDEQGYTQIHRASRESHQSYFAITPTGPDTGARVNSLNQVKLYDRLMEDLALQRGDLVFFLKNENGRWEIRPEAEVLPEVDEALNGSANQQA